MTNRLPSKLPVAASLGLGLLVALTTFGASGAARASLPATHQLTLQPASTPVRTVPLPGSRTRTFPETGKTVRGSLAYWRPRRLAQQGYPLTRCSECRPGGKRTRCNRRACVFDTTLRTPRPTTCPVALGPSATSRITLTARLSNAQLRAARSFSADRQAVCAPSSKLSNKGAGAASLPISEDSRRKRPGRQDLQSAVLRASGVRATPGAAAALQRAPVATGHLPPAGQVPQRRARRSNSHAWGGWHQTLAHQHPGEPRVRRHPGEPEHDGNTQLRHPALRLHDRVLSRASAQGAGG